MWILLGFNPDCMEVKRLLYTLSIPDPHDPHDHNISVDHLKWIADHDVAKPWLLVFREGTQGNQFWNIYTWPISDNHPLTHHAKPQSNTAAVLGTFWLLQSSAKIVWPGVINSGMVGKHENHRDVSFKRDDEYHPCLGRNLYNQLASNWFKVTPQAHPRSFTNFCWICGIYLFFSCKGRVPETIAGQFLA